MPPANLELKPLDAIQVIKPVFPFCRRTAQIPLVISETLGYNTPIDPPVLEPMQLVDKEGNVFTANATQLFLERRDGSGKLVRVSEQSAPGSMPAPVLIPANSRAQFVLTVGQLSSAGTYEGVISVRSPNGTGVSKDIELQVKDDWYLVLLVIVAGVALATFVQRWRQSGRDRALNFAAIAEVRDSVTALAKTHPESDQVCNLLLSRLDGLSTQNTRSVIAAPDLTASLDDINGRRAVYAAALSLFKAINAMQDVPQDIAAKLPEIRSTLETELLKNDAPSLTNARAELVKLERLQLDARRAPLLTAVTADKRVLSKLELDTIRESHPDLVKASEGLHERASLLVERVKTANDVDALNQAARQREVLLADYARWRQDSMKASIDNLIKRIQAWEEKPDAPKNELVTLRGDAQGALDRLNQDNLQATQEEYNTLSRQYAKLQIESDKKRLEKLLRLIEATPSDWIGDADPVDGINGTTWVNNAHLAINQLNQELDGGAYEESHLKFVRLLIQTMTELTDRVRAQNPPPPQTVSKRLTRANNLVSPPGAGSVPRREELVEGENLTYEAIAEYLNWLHANVEAPSAGLRDLLTSKPRNALEGAARGQVAVADQPTEDAGRPLTDADLHALTAGGPDLFGAPDPNATAAQWYVYIQRTERLSFWLGVLVASLTGLIALWYNDPIFGSAKDYVTAFLWGFTVQTITAGVGAATTGAGAAAPDPAAQWGKHMPEE